MKNEKQRLIEDIARKLITAMKSVDLAQFQELWFTVDDQMEFIGRLKNAGTKGELSQDEQEQTRKDFLVFVNKVIEESFRKLSETGHRLGINWEDCQLKKVSFRNYTDPTNGQSGFSGTIQVQIKDSTHNICKMEGLYLNSGPKLFRIKTAKRKKAIVSSFN